MLYSDFDLREFFKKHRKQILISISMFWLIFAVLIIFENEVSLYISKKEVDPLDRLQYCIRWILWFLLTPLVILLSIKYPITRRNLSRSILLHFSFAIVVIGIEFIIEIPIIRAATLYLTGKVPPVIEYAAVFILKLNIYLLLYFLVVGTTYLVLYIENYSRSKLQATEAAHRNQLLQSQLTEAKLSLLKMQLDPHFLFNTHHAIVSLMINNENDKAIKMLTRLSDLLRLSLEDQQRTIPLEKEIQLLKLYLDIQQVRFQDRLLININIDPSLLQFTVPAFILQPIVENAIKYGISASSKASRISIVVTLKDNMLELKVENDGNTIDFSNFKEGIGIKNTKERLSELYNGKASFVIENVDDHTVKVLIRIPIDKMHHE